jgi:hypothetical protein
MITSRTILCFPNFVFSSLLIFFINDLKCSVGFTTYRFDGDFQKAGYFQWAFTTRKFHFTYLRMDGSGVALVGSCAERPRNKEYED